MSSPVFFFFLRKIWQNEEGRTILSRKLSIHPHTGTHDNDFIKGKPKYKQTNSDRDCSLVPSVRNTDKVKKRSQNMDALVIYQVIYSVKCRKSTQLWSKISVRSRSKEEVGTEEKQEENSKNVMEDKR